MQHCHDISDDLWFVMINYEIKQSEGKITLTYLIA